jgi:hypothetical protein
MNAVKPDERETSSSPLEQPLIALEALERSMEVSSVTTWRWRKRNWLKVINISGRNYVSQESLAEFNRRAAAGEFSKDPNITAVNARKAGSTPNN